MLSRSTAAFLENFHCQGPLDIPDPIVYTGDPKAYDKCYWMVCIDSDSCFTKETFLFLQTIFVCPLNKSIPRFTNQYKD